MKWQNIGGWAWLVPLAAIIALLCIPCTHRLTVREYEGDRLLLSLPISRGEEFGIRYTHSVNLSDVTDTLEWTGHELILRSSLFTSFGAGMPVLADGIGQSMENTPEGFLIRGIDKVQQDALIPIMLQEVPNHRLLYRDGEIWLRRLLPGDVVFIGLRVERAPLWHMLYCRL